jgi:hypothetical protein
MNLSIDIDKFILSTYLFAKIRAIMFFIIITLCKINVEVNDGNNTDVNIHPSTDPH